MPQYGKTKTTETTVTKTNDICDEIKGKWNPGKACFYFLQSLSEKHTY
jgi:hypothetical protein